MVFVHARNSTVHTASKLQEIAKRNGEIGLFQPEQSPELGTAAKQVCLSSCPYWDSYLNIFMLYLWNTNCQDPTALLENMSKLHLHVEILTYSSTIIKFQFRFVVSLSVLENS